MVLTIGIHGDGNIKTFANRMSHACLCRAPCSQLLGQAKNVCSCRLGFCGGVVLTTIVYHYHFRDALCDSFFNDTRNCGFFIKSGDDDECSILVLQGSDVLCVKKIFDG